MERIIEASELDAYRKRVKHIIDVRSPSEFAEDHLPGAINVPMLSDMQRAEVGTLYKQNPFEARKLGSVYALEAIHGFMKTPLIAQMGKSEGFMVYCARGGQRSGSLSLVLSQIGFAVFRLKQGYKTWRASVLAQLARELPHPVYILQGYTGSQKTRILLALKDRMNIIDLEGCARHRGSLLGDLPNQAQPGQRAFETLLGETMSNLKPNLPTLIEGESRKIGRCTVPKPLWDQMIAGRYLWLEMPRPARVAFILKDYHELKDTSYLELRLKKLARYLPHKVNDALSQDMATGRWEALVDRLLEYHYDPLYGKSRKRQDLDRIEAGNFEEAVGLVERLILHSTPLV